MNIDKRQNQKLIFKSVLVSGIFFGLSILLALMNNHWISTDGWFSFLAAGFLAAGMFWAGCRVFKDSSIPRSILYLAIGAIFLRLFLGAVWHTGLPVWGHENEVQEAGYIYEDAFGRDQDAWELAKSDDALIEAFKGYSHKDQYGGMLFFSAAIYRYLGADFHQPILIIVFTSMASGLAVLYVWAFAAKAWGVKQGTISAWLLALYPEAVLLGSSQMREAFLILFAVVSANGILKLKRRNLRRLDYFLVGGFALACFTISASFFILMIISAIFVRISYENWKPLKDRRVQLVVGLLLLIIAAILFWPQLDGSYFEKITRFQNYLTIRSSGWIQKIVSETPGWFNSVFLLIYGLVRPLLPAALFDDGILFWRVIETFRALGWTVFLGGLIYSTYLVIRRSAWKKLIGGLILIVWSMLIIASVRGGGDQWDNPRYRAAFSGIQAVVLAWAYIEYQNKKEPWLKRFVVMGGAMVVVFSFWYAFRYIHFPWIFKELMPNIILGFIIGGLYWAWDIYKTRSI